MRGGLTWARLSRAGWLRAAGPAANARSRFCVARSTNRSAALVRPCPQDRPRIAHTQRIVPDANTPAPLATV